jgi:molybdenum cofactor cytidylyltransferase
MATPRHDPASPVVLLLAAGEGNRFGSIKQLVDIAGEPMVRRVARIALASGLPVIVVTGAHAAQVEAALDDLLLHIVRCEDWHLGMGNSLAAGVRALASRFPQASSTLICLADQPLLDAPFIRTMVQRHAQAPDRLLASEQNGVPGPPVLFPRDCFEKLIAHAGPRGARALLEQEAARVEIFGSDNVIDVDTPDDLRRVQDWLARSTKQPM